MPLYDVKCPAGHVREVLLYAAERLDVLKKNGGVIVVPCPEEGCGLRAEQQIGLTGSMAIQWKRAAHG